MNLSSDFLIELAKACLVSGEILDAIKPHLNYSFLPNEQYKQIFKYIIDHHSATSKPPTIGLLSQNVNSRDCLEIIGRIREANVHDSKAQIIDSFETFLKRSRFVNLHKKTEELYNSGKHDKAMSVLAEESKQINEFSLKTKLHSRIFADFDKRQDERQQRDYSTVKIATGIPAFDYHTRGGIDRGTGLLGIARSGVGKAQPLYSKIYTPDGQTTMGQINAGDIVLSEKGDPIKVLATFPQGIRSVYRITFSDGVQVDCDENHLWKVYTAYDRKRVSDSLQYANTNISKDKHTILSTKQMIGNEMASLYGQKKVTNFKMPICQPLKFSKKILDIPPYTLGALIGDGSFSNGDISTIDEQILNRVATELKATVRLKPGGCSYTLSKCNLKQRLSNLFGGHRLLSYDKFIPKQYLYSSIEDRIDLLRGLMDTDGYVSKERGICEFFTSSIRLANDVVELINTLGGIAYLNNFGKATYVHRGEKLLSTHDSYRITINLPSHINPFYLDRKVERVVPKSKYLTPRYIESIQYVGEMETKCILVDSPTHLYVTDNCVVTHNTTFLRSLGANAAFRGVNVLHIAGGDSTKQEIEDGYDSWWTGIDMHSMREGDVGSVNVKKINQARTAWLSQCGEIYVHVFKQFHTASMLDVRNILIELLKECDIGLVLFDLLESFDPGDGKRYGTNQEGNSARKKAVAEKIVNIATEFNIAVAAVTQASDISKEQWNDPNFVITRNHISNLKATIDPFAYCVTLNQTEGENDNEIMRIHEEKLRHYKVLSYWSTYHIAQKRDVGRFIDLAATNQRFWDPIGKKIIRDKPKA